MAIHPISIESAGGEYMESVLIISWEVKPGERVKAGQLLVTVETAKAATEIEAERDGWLAEILYQEGTEAPVKAVLGTLSDEEIAAPATGQAAPSGAKTETAEHAAPETKEPAASQRVVASPLARRLARNAGVDLSTVHGTGPRGRIKQRDIDAALAQKAKTEAAGPPSLPQEAVPVLSASHISRSATVSPVILLHGFAADRTAWRQVRPLMPADIEIITLDLPGHGAEAATSAFGIENIGFALSDRIEALGITSAHIVGHSLGGAAALQLSALGRVDVRSMTLLAPGGLGPDIHGGFISGLTGSASPEALDHWLGFMVGSRAVLPDGYAGAVFRQMQKAGNAPVLRSMAKRLFPGGTQSFSMAPALAALSIPTRIIWGRSDRVVPSSHVADVPGFAAVHILNGIGHVPHMEDPSLCARLITQTIRSAM